MKLKKDHDWWPIAERALQLLIPSCGAGKSGGRYDRVFSKKQ